MVCVRCAVVCCIPSSQRWCTVAGLHSLLQASHPLSKLRGVVRRAVVEGLGERLSLYTTPPKVVLKDMDTNFYQVGLTRSTWGADSGPAR